MTDRPWYTDPRMLEAGNVRGLPTDPEPMAPSMDVVRVPDLAGDLNAAAERLGVDVADLVRARRRLGIAAAHRRPGLIARLLTRKR